MALNPKWGRRKRLPEEAEGASSRCKKILKKILKKVLVLSSPTEYNKRYEQRITFKVSRRRLPTLNQFRPR